MNPRYVSSLLSLLRHNRDYCFVRQFSMSSKVKRLSSMAGSNVTDFLIKCMEIQSTTGSEESFGAFLADTLTSDGWCVERQMVPDTTRFNVLATRKPITKDHSPRLIFNSHLDTVPPYIPPTKDDKNVYGRGSNDAKGQLACMILAANRLAEKRPDIADQIGLLFVVGEELDHVGMIAANQIPHIQPEYLVVGEPTELKFGTLQKGSFKVHIRTSGVPGHSGYPHTGTSAIHKLIEIVNDILKYDWPKHEKNGDTTLNVGFISGGQALNAWAEKAEASVFFRVTTSVEDIKTRLESIVKDRATIDCSLGGNDPVPLTVPPLEAPTAAVAFNTDLPYYNKRDTLKGAFLFGAGSITTAHSYDEFVPIKELEECVDTHYNLVIQLLQ